MYKLDYTDKAMLDMQRLKHEEPKAFQKLSKLLEELMDHPKTGTGHPEQLKGNRNSIIILTSIFMVAIVSCIILHCDLKKRRFVEKITEQYNSFSEEEKERNALKWGLLAILPMVSFLILCVVFIFIQNHY